MLRLCCYHHHHHQLLGEANFVNQRPACHLFSGHVKLCETKSQIHTIHILKFVFSSGTPADGDVFSPLHLIGTKMLKCYDDMESSPVVVNGG